MPALGTKVSPAFVLSWAQGTLSQLENLVPPPYGDTAPPTCQGACGECLRPHCSELPVCGLGSLSPPSGHSFHLTSVRPIPSTPCSLSSALKQSNSFWAPCGARKSLPSTLRIPARAGKKAKISPTDPSAHELKPWSIISWHLPCLNSVRQETTSSLTVSASLNSANILSGFSFFLLGYPFLVLCSAHP